MDNEALATELLKEVKATSKRWFIAFIVTLSLWFATIIGFVLYEYYTLPTEETSIEQDMEDIDGDNIKQIVGDDYGESTTERDTQKNR